MIDIVFFIVLLATPPTATRCVIYLDDEGQTYETCREVVVREPSLVGRLEPVSAP